ncbi:MAG: hypothetical protein WA624_20575 [Methylocella sp.]
MQHHTELNEIYWSFVPLESHANYVARNRLDTDLTANVFSASGADVRRLARELGGWKRDFQEMENWLRLSLVVAALGYLEVYIKSIAELALRSCPGILYGKPRAIEGVNWLKLGIEPDIGKELESLVKGEWSSRVAAYKRLFSGIPAILEGAVGPLDELRILRNGVSHAFGRNVDYTFNSYDGFHPKASRLSESKLKKGLYVIENVATAMDQQLSTEFIGEYEAIAFYHSWMQIPRRDRIRNNSGTDSFRKALTRTFSETYGEGFCDSLIAFYRSA